MMNDILIKISKETRMVDVSKSLIGNDGENLQGNLIFRFKDELVNGIARLEYEIQGEKKYAILSKKGDEYVIPIKSVLTKVGQINMQLVITEDDTAQGVPIFKSNVFYVYCNKSINAEIEQSDEYESESFVLNYKQLLNKINDLEQKINKILDGNYEIPETDNKQINFIPIGSDDSSELYDTQNKKVDVNENLYIKFDNEEPDLYIDGDDLFTNSDINLRINDDGEGVMEV